MNKLLYFFFELFFITDYKNFIKLVVLVHFSLCIDDCFMHALDTLICIFVLLFFSCRTDDRLKERLSEFLVFNEMHLETMKSCYSPVF